MNDIIDQLLAGIPRDKIEEVTLVSGDRRVTYKLHPQQESTVEQCREEGVKEEE